MDTGEIEVESGRIVIVPKRRRPRGPMADNCAVVAVPTGRVYVTVYYVQVAGHPGTAGLRRVLVSLKAPCDSPAPVHVLIAHAPFLVIADHAFVYPRSPGPMSEPGRALRACEGSRRSGTFRADSSDVGVALRTGWKRGKIRLGRAQDGFACEFDPEQDADAA